MVENQRLPGGRVAQRQVLYHGEVNDSQLRRLLARLHELRRQLPERDKQLMDCARLEWAAVDLIAGTLAFTQEKTTTALVVLMHDELREHLEALASTDKPEQFVMPGMAQQPGSGRNGLSSAFKRIAGKAGVDMQTV